MAENEQDGNHPFGHFIKSLGETLNLGQMALKEAGRELVWGALRLKPRASAVNLGSLAMGNTL